MSCYFVARIRIEDREEYQNYLDGTDGLLAKYGGEVIAVDEEPTLLEGEWRHTRMVMIRFAGKEEALRWYDSPEYQELAAHRWRSSYGDILLVDGRD